MTQSSCISAFEKIRKKNVGHSCVNGSKWTHGPHLHCVEVEGHGVIV